MGGSSSSGGRAGGRCCVCVEARQSIPMRFSQDHLHCVALVMTPYTSVLLLLLFSPLIECNDPNQRSRITHILQAVLRRKIKPGGGGEGGRRGGAEADARRRHLV